jgi:glycosyltransferase involved in cell wall biosynthesis
VDRAATVILFTAAYPCDPLREVTFVAPELEQLAAVFDRVIVVPAEFGEQRVPLPDGRAELATTYAARIHPSSERERARMLARAMASPWMWGELLRYPSLIAHPRMLRRLSFCVAAADTTGRWLCELFEGAELHPESTLVYTFWLNHITAGAGRARTRVPGLKIVSRAHGADVYAKRYTPAYLPLHRHAVVSADSVFVVSQAARNHLAEHYRDSSSRFLVAPLGTPDPGFTAEASNDGVFRIVSCSELRPIKRIPLLINGLAVLARRRPEVVVEWHHIGGGEEEVELRRWAVGELPANVRWRIHGWLPPAGVTDFYRENPVDLFVSVSASEGKPVSMMEAQSCSVSVLATAVGGVAEMVTPENGRLLPRSATPDDVADGIATMLDDPDRSAKRTASRRQWELGHDAARVGRQFAQTLRGLLDRSTQRVS